MPGRSVALGVREASPAPATLRVASSTTESTAVMLPGDRLAVGPPSTVTRTSRPTRSSAHLLLRQREVDVDRVERLQRHDRVARVQVLPEVDLADAEHARERRADRACARSWRGSRRPAPRPACARRSSRSSSACGDDRPRRRARCARSRLSARARRCASAAASCARSWRASRRTSTSPSRTERPDSNVIASTTPGRSALTVTPCTAAHGPDRR